MIKKIKRKCKRYVVKQGRFEIKLQKTPYPYRVYVRGVNQEILKECKHNGYNYNKANKRTRHFGNLSSAISFIEEINKRVLLHLLTK